MKHTCTVCGFPDMQDAPRDFEICPCCGTEFGLDDEEHTLEQLRQDWILGGMKWFSRTTKPPYNWNAREQLATLEVELRKAR